MRADILNLSHKRVFIEFADFGDPRAQDINPGRQDTDTFTLIFLAVQSRGKKAFQLV